LNVYNNNILNGLLTFWLRYHMLYIWSLPSFNSDLYYNYVVNTENKTDKVYHCCCILFYHTCMTLSLSLSI